MAIIVNTNMTALKTQRNLNTATANMNSALERMSTGYKINRSKDDAAGMYVATGLTTQINGSKVAKNNIETGNNVLATLEGDLDVIMDNLHRIRDLATQAANSVYDASAMDAMKAEVEERLNEIDRVSLASNFNGLKMLDGTGKLSTDGLRLQVGANANAEANSVVIDASFFNQAVDSDNLGTVSMATTAGVASPKNPTTENPGTQISDSDLRSNLTQAFAAATSAASYIAVVDNAINTIAAKKSKIGAVQNRLDSAAASLTTTIENNTAAKSTIMDADIAEESANYTKAQILQQTSAALLVQANALPQIAISLVQG